MLVQQSSSHKTAKNSESQTFACPMTTLTGLSRQKSLAKCLNIMGRKCC